MSWYKEWFESPLYERIYADRDEREARRLVNWLKNVIPPAEYPEVLDLGCGRGRHAVNLADEGYHVLGIDLSESAIQKAHKVKEERNLDNVEFEVGDMRDGVPHSFDAIVNLFTSFGYFEADRENAKIIENVSQMLRPDGVFVLDYFNSFKVRQDYVSEETGTVEDIRYEISRYIEEGAIIKEMSFKGDSVNGTSFYKERVKLYDLPWFRQVFGKHQLQLIETYGDYDGSAYDKEESPRLIMMARKGKA